MRWFSSAVMLLALTLATSAAIAQQDDARPDERTVVRTYNVSDLMRIVTNYPLDARGTVPGAAPGFGAQGGGEFGMFMEKPPAPRPGAHEPLTTLLTDLVDPNSWAENGGDLGLIRTFDSLLVIRQTPQNHDQIEQLLAEIRKTAGPAQVVSVRAIWVLLPPGQSPKPGDAVTAEWLAAQTPYCEATTVCFSGQSVHVTSGRGRTVISKLTPVIGDGSAGYDPDADMVQSGVSFQVAAQLVPGTDRAIIDIQSYVTEWIQPPPPAEFNLAVANSEASPSASVDRVNLVAQRIKTTLRAPVAKLVAVGGMTLEPSDDESARQQLCLIIEVNAVK